MRRLAIGLHGVLINKFKSSQALKARLQSPKDTGAKQNLTQNDHSRLFKVTCLGVSGRTIREGLSAARWCSG